MPMIHNYELNLCLWIIRDLKTVSISTRKMISSKIVTVIIIIIIVACFMSLDFYLCWFFLFCYKNWNLLEKQLFRDSWIFLCLEIRDLRRFMLCIFISIFKFFIILLMTITIIICVITLMSFYERGSDSQNNYYKVLVGWIHSVIDKRNKLFCNFSASVWASFPQHEFILLSLSDYFLR